MGQFTGLWATLYFLIQHTKLFFHQQYPFGVIKLQKTRMKTAVRVLFGPYNWFDSKGIFFSPAKETKH